jgi:hypothetical protein
MIDQDYNFLLVLGGSSYLLLPLRAKSKLQLKDCQVAMLVMGRLRRKEPAHVEATNSPLIPAAASLS